MCGGVGLEIIVLVSVPCAVARKFTGFIGREADLVRMNSDIEFLIIIGTPLLSALVPKPTRVFSSLPIRFGIHDTYTCNDLLGL